MWDKKPWKFFQVILKRLILPTFQKSHEGPSPKSLDSEKNYDYDYTQKWRICRENSKYALDENFHGHFCFRWKAANFLKLENIWNGSFHHILQITARRHFLIWNFPSKLFTFWSSRFDKTGNSPTWIFFFFANASVIWSCTRELAKFCNWNQNCWSDAFSTLSQPKVLNHHFKERRETICNELQCSFTFGFSLWPMVRAIYSGHFQQYFTQFWPS